MAHYAFLDENNVVTEVIAGKDETDTSRDWEAYYGAIRNQVCKRTSYNNNIRKQFAGIGYTYDPAADVFIEPQPFPSWALDANYDWQPPTPKPEGVYMPRWDEATLSWVAL
jgi:hypothetical protein